MFHMRMTSYMFKNQTKIDFILYFCLILINFLNMESKSICPLCNLGFENVPESEIFDSECKCVDSKFHAGCIEELYKHNKHKGDKSLDCPTCRNTKIKNYDIHKFLLNHRPMTKENTCYLYIKGKANEKGTNAFFMMIYVIAFYWMYILIYKNIQLSDTIIKNEEDKCRQIICNGTITCSQIHENHDNYENYTKYTKCIKDAQKLKNTGIIGANILLMGVSMILISFKKKIFEPIVFSTGLILTCIIWDDLLKYGMYEKFSSLTPADYICKLYLITIVSCSVVIIIYRHIIGCNYHRKIDDTIQLKTGYDYEEDQQPEENINLTDNQDIIP